MQRLRILVILILLSLMPLYSLAVLNEGQYAFRSLDIQLLKMINAKTKFIAIGIGVTVIFYF